MKITSALFKYFIAAILIILAGCNGNSTNVSSKRTDSVIIATGTQDSSHLESEYDSLYNFVKDTYKGAAITQPIKYTSFFIFSNPMVADTFELSILPGPLAQSISIFTIRASNKIIYADSFHTRHLIDDMFTCNVSQVCSQSVYDKYQIDYLNSLTIAQIENFVTQKADSFFNSMFVKDADIKNTDDGLEIVDTPLYNEVISDTSIKIIYLMCLDCEEGGSFFAYSKKIGKAVPIVSFD